MGQIAMFGDVTEQITPRYIDGHYTGLPVRVAAVMVVDAMNPNIMRFGCVQCIAHFPSDSFLVAHVMQCHRGSHV